MNRAGCGNFLLVIIPLLWLANGQAATKQTIGWLEYAHIGEANMRLEAKIDTGADTTSIKAKILKKFSVDGQAWIRFRLMDDHWHTAVLERKIERYVRIKRKMAPSIRRPVIRLGICIGNIYRDVEVNLSDRKNFKYQLLIGRNYLHDVYLVDAAQRHAVQPICPGIKGD